MANVATYLVNCQCACREIRQYTTRQSDVVTNKGAPHCFGSWVEMTQLWLRQTGIYVQANTKFGARSTKKTENLANLKGDTLYFESAFRMFVGFCFGHFSQPTLAVPP